LPQQTVLSHYFKLFYRPGENRGGKSGQHRAPYLANNKGEAKEILLQQKVPQKKVALICASIVRVIVKTWGKSSRAPPAMTEWGKPYGLQGQISSGKENGSLIRLRWTGTGRPQKINDRSHGVNRHDTKPGL